MTVTKNILKTLKVIANRIIAPQYLNFARDFREYVLNLFAKNPPVLIYQMGKVGSQSIYYSLLESGYKPIVFFHYLEHLKSQKQWEYRYLSKVLKCKKKTKIITVVREPVSRNLSSFAHDFPGYFGGKMQDYRSEDLERLFWRYDRHSLGVDWFDDEFKKTTGINVYDYPFDKAKGLSVFSTDNFDLLIIKLEISNELKQKAIREFTNLPEFQLKKHNDASASNYKGGYYNFVETISLPKTYLDELYQSKFCRHFYSQDEILEFTNKWLRIYSKLD